jgi:integrase
MDSRIDLESSKPEALVGLEAALIQWAFVGDPERMSAVASDSACDTGFRDIDMIDAHRRRVRRPAPDEAIKVKAEECSEACAASSRLGPYEAVRLKTLGSPQSQRAYGIAIDDFIGWYCSEPRIAFNKTVVLRYRIQLETKHLAPATINLRLAAVRRLAYEAADVGLLSPDLAAGIRRVKGAKRLGVRLGNWLSAEQAKDMLRCPNREALIGKRDCAILALLLGCGLRRSETAQLTLEHFQRRDDHWAIVDLFGKGGHIRSVPVPDWVKSVLDRWTAAAQIESGSLFRCVTKYGTVWGHKITEKVIWHVVRNTQCALNLARLPLMT